MHGNRRKTSGNGVTRRARRPKQKKVNLKTCPQCGAKPGQTCFVLTEKVFRELSETHTTASVFQDEYREPRPGFEELPTRKTSTGILDARHAARGQKQAESAARVNGVAKLAPPKPAEIFGVRADNSPLLAPGQVYVTKSGGKYHPAWCASVAACWDSKPDSLVVAWLADVGQRGECAGCANPLTTSGL